MLNCLNCISWVSYYFNKLEWVDISFQKKNLIHDQNTFPQCVNTKSCIQRSYLKFDKTLCYVQKNKWMNTTDKKMIRQYNLNFTPKKNCPLHDRTFTNVNRQWHISMEKQVIVVHHLYEITLLEWSNASKKTNKTDLFQ